MYLKPLTSVTAATVAIPTAVIQSVTRTLVTLTVTLIVIKSVIVTRTLRDPFEKRLSLTLILPIASVLLHPGIQP